MKTTNPYSIFLMVELARCYNIIPKDLEYDTTWEIAQGLYSDFQTSKFDIDTKGEYECIEDYLQDYNSKK